MDKGLYKLNSVDQVGTDTTSETGLNKRASSLSATLPYAVFVTSSSDCKDPSIDTMHARLDHTFVSKMKNILLGKHLLPRPFL